MADGHSDKDESVAEKDPLSFFTAGDSSSSSDSESDKDAEEHEEGTLTSNSSGRKPSLTKTKLPSPTTLFATVGRPAFLESKEESHVDWDSLSKRYEPNTYSAPPVQFSSVAESRESEEYEDAVISSAPVKYGKEISDIQKHLVIHDKRSVKVALNILNDRGESTPKKQKTDNFRQKEKRKRDQGQSSRGKSYVEEEKRVLRQDFSAE
ncbi:UPF0690 protein C1orf52 homolog isoform X2 [Orbicella faveolata]|uniref:UPF0690 protein C1orf52 homolog isoform X2 n=1 Tax=Orbicella faveolata TaxID=48498 RepID=UPI0009E28923|nr:UPF0690 protein C1orf52 homolog isoform X2 [Orbicella faveolata]